MRVGLIGFGGIGKTVAQALSEPSVSERFKIVGVLLNSGRIEAAQQADQSNLKYVDNLTDLFNLKPDIIVECANHAVVEQFGERILAEGIDFIVISAGALANPRLYAALTATIRTSQATLYVPSGALAGIDGLRAAYHAGISRVCYTGRKPPSAWIGTPAEEVVDLSTLKGSVTIFKGNARDAALQFPKNSNVAAIIALAGIGFEKTEVNLTADADADANYHILEVQAKSGSFQVSLMGQTLPGKPRTSALAAYSVVKCLVDRQSALVF